MSRINEFNQIIGPNVDDWKPALFPDRKSNIIGSTVTLVPYDGETHALALFDAINHDNDGSSWTYLPYGPFSDVNEFKKSMSSFASSADVVSYTVFDNKTNKPVGTCSYLRIVPDHGVIEIGHIHFSTLMKRSTASTESIYLLNKHAFDDLGYRRMEWKCDALNGPSKSAALRFGFTFEGLFQNIRCCTYV